MARVRPQAGAYLARAVLYTLADLVDWEHGDTRGNRETISVRQRRFNADYNEIHINNYMLSRA